MEKIKDENNSFAFELLKEQKLQAKRFTYGLMIIILALIGIILYKDYQIKELLYNMEFETTTTEITQDTEGSGNNSSVIGE